ncbi:MAG TPA: SDR family NAD(P)-dependent oxidoreductase [Cellvibrionaceae bacterium]
MNNQLAGKHIWITGASKGLGLALTRQLLALGVNVYATARSTDGLDQLLTEYPGSCFAVGADITNEQQLVCAREKINSFTPYLDAIILNAGTCEYVNTKAFSSEPFVPVMSLNFMANVKLLEMALPLLRNCPTRGHIVGISSMVTLLPMPRSEAYGASKAALDYCLQSLRVDLYDEGIDVSIVKPGFIRTPLTDRNDFDMPFLMEADAAAEHVLKTLRTRHYEYRFPWQLSSIMSLISWLPKGLQTRMLQKLVKH